MRNKSVARGSALATDTMKRFDHRSFTEAMMYHDFLTYLPDDILVKVDRAAMSNSLETRAPFLDHRVVEHAFRLPLKYKVRDGQSKWILRQILYRHVPQKLIERPKMGFGIPVEDWLRTRLRPWAEELLSKERLEEHGFLDTQTITNKWTEHVSGKRNWISPIWTVLMFQAWFKHHAASH
jgi:asparagine synthase (glutamine-hydrolysing)